MHSCLCFLNVAQAGVPTITNNHNRKTGKGWFEKYKDRNGDKTQFHFPVIFCFIWRYWTRFSFKLLTYA